MAGRGIDRFCLSGRCLLCHETCRVHCEGHSFLRMDSLVSMRPKEEEIMSALTLFMNSTISTGNRSVCLGQKNGRAAMAWTAGNRTAPAGETYKGRAGWTDAQRRSSIEKTQQKEHNTGQGGTRTVRFVRTTMLLTLGWSGRMATRHKWAERGVVAPGGPCHFEPRAVFASTVQAGKLALNPATTDEGTVWWVLGGARGQTGQYNMVLARGKRYAMLCTQRQNTHTRMPHGIPERVCHELASKIWFVHLDNKEIVGQLRLWVDTSWAAQQQQPCFYSEAHGIVPQKIALRTLPLDGPTCSSASNGCNYCITIVLQNSAKRRRFHSEPTTAVLTNGLFFLFRTMDRTAKCDQGRPVHDGSPTVDYLSKACRVCKDAERTAADLHYRTSTTGPYFSSPITCY